MFKLVGNGKFFYRQGGIESMGKREKVWLAVAGVVSYKNKWLVVKKKYGGLKGQWSFPAGFVDEGETIDEAIIREVIEETGIEATIEGVLGIRTGVIKDTISDNMIVFEMKAESKDLKVDARELEEAVFLDKQELVEDPDSSLMIHYFLNKQGLKVQELNPGDQFGYTKYKIFDFR
jgi:8-oxo-dGTP diphosphatase